MNHDQLIETMARGMCDHDYEGNSEPFTGDIMWGDERIRIAYIARATAALTAIEAAGMRVDAGWQPIETAPRDGTQILMYGGEPGYDDDGAIKPKCFTAWWEQFRNPTWDGQTGMWRFCSYDSGYYGEWKNPTHWMPLPAPPAQEDSTSE